MSFILDALKKSERERQRTAVPGISDLPIVVHSSRSLPWATLGIVAFVVVAALLSWTLRQAPLATLPAASETREIARPEAAPPPTAIPATRSLASEVTRVVSARNVVPSNAISEADEAAAAPTAAPAARGRGIVTEAPMSILEARAAGMSVPELTLELLVFSEDPRQRFVYINAAKYVEGDTLSEGPRLAEISSEGAVLTFDGRTFLLPQN